MNPARDNVHPFLVSSVDNTADVALICTPDLIVERLNLVARSFLAIDRGTSLLTVVNPEDTEMLGDAISREEGTILHARINQAGAWRLCRVGLTPFALPDGILWHMRIVDVTDVVLNARYNQTILAASLRFGWAEWHDVPPGRNTVFSPEAYAIVFGHKVAEPRQVLWDDLRAVFHPEVDYDALMHQIREAGSRGESYRLEFAVVHPDGQVHWIESLGAASEGLDGRRIYGGLLRDMTRDREQALRLIRARHAESLRILAGGIAHDFNNKLQVIIGHLSLAQDMLETEYRDGSEQVLQSLNWAAEAADQARTLARELMALARNAPAESRPIPVQDLAAATRAVLSNRPAIGFELKLPDGLWCVVGDRTQVAQVIENIVYNAVDAMPSGGTIRFQAQNLPQGSQKRVEILISDSGPGIAEDLLEAIFDPYYSTKSHGHGLGLATTYAIVQQHGGSIQVETSEWGGACFRIILPACDGRALETLPGRAHPIATLKGQLLIVDDDPIVLASAKAMAQSFGLDVAAAASGPEALDWLGSHPCDMVLLDWVLGDPMSGREALDILRKTHPGLVVAVSTGFADVPIPAGVPGLPKPYTRQRLGEVLADLLFQPGMDN